GLWRLTGDTTVASPISAPPTLAVTRAEPPTVTSRWVDLHQGLPAEGFGQPNPHVLPGPDDGVSCAPDGSSVLRPPPDSAELSLSSQCGTEPPCSQWGVDASRVLEFFVSDTGERVLVFVVAAQVDPRPRALADSQFHLHRRQLGALVLYELSRLSRPVALPAFEQ
nr:hypothetical protein [Deltaproteobacteria bacterium]